MAETATTRRSRITPEREAELYEAVLDLLREVGYDSLTMDAVATRTRSSKATLYRQWGGKAELVARAIRHHKPVDPAAIDTGSLRGDFQALAQAPGRLPDGTGLRADASPRHGGAHEPRAAGRPPRMADRAGAGGDASVVQRAVDRGEVRADNPAIEYLMHMIIGAFAARTLIDEQPPTQAFVSSYIDAVVIPALSA
jgi:AcrR family transcriptional regulator